MVYASGHDMSCPSQPEPVCPHCGSRKLTFLEHGSGVTVFRCENCVRATVQRWTPAPPAKSTTTVRHAPPPSSLAMFPNWFLGLGGR
jgi:hypothetical protein